MGMYYTANYGIGYILDVSSLNDLEDLECKVSENSVNCKIYSSGNSFVGSEGIEYYIFHIDPLRNGLNLEQTKKDVDDCVEYLKTIYPKIDVKSDFGLYGGVLMF